MTGVVLLGALAGAAFAAVSPVGTWKRSTGNVYRWVSLGGGALGEISLTSHRTPADHCLVKPQTLVYRYHPLGNGVYREDEFTWSSNCAKTYWNAGAELVKIGVTATKLTLYCGKPYTKSCATYTRVDTAAPTVKALQSTGKVGGDTSLRYLVSDASGRTWESLLIYSKGIEVRRYRTTLGPAKAGRVYAYKLKQTPANFRGTFRFCVQSHDAAGNVSKPSCATVTIS